MTRKENSGRRSLIFSDWIRRRLPDSMKTGMRVWNLDWIFWDKHTRRVILVEEKTHGRSIASDFYAFMKSTIHPALEDYPGVEYRGFYVVTFENEGPEDGDIFLNGHLVTEDELCVFLSLGLSVAEHAEFLQMIRERDGGRSIS